MPRPLEGLALDHAGVGGLVVDWHGARVAVLGTFPATASMPEVGARSAAQWVACPMLAEDGGEAGRLWALLSDAPDEERLRGAAALLAPVVALRAERDLLAGKLHHVERAVHAADMGLWEWDVRSGHAYSGNNWPALLGYAPGEVEMSYAGWISLVHPDDLPLTEATLQAFLGASDQHGFRIEQRLLHRSGEWRWTLSLGDVASRWPDGSPRVLAGTLQDIQAQKAFRIALIESEAYARSLFESSPDGIQVIGLDGTVQDVSAGGLRLLGLQARDELIGASWVAQWQQPYDGQAAEVLAVVAQGHTHRFRGAKAVAGEQRWCDVFAAPLRDADGSIGRILVTSRDVTAQARTEEELRRITVHMEDLVTRQTAEIRDNERRLRSILSNLDGMAYRWRVADGREIFFVSDGVLALLGVEPQLVGSADVLLERFVHPDDRPGVRAVWESIAGTGVQEHEFRIVDAQGRERWIHERLCLVHAGGQATGCVDAMLTDVTERRDMLRALTLANHTLEESLVSVFWLDAHGRGLQANRATARLLGYSQEELRRLDLSRIHPGFGDDGHWARLREAVRTDGPQQLHVKLRHRDGRELPVFVFITSVEFEGNEIYVGFASDESSRLEDQRARKESDLLSRAALGALSARIAILDRDGIVLATNRAWEEGPPSSMDRPRAVIGSSWPQRLSQSNHPAAAAVHAGLLAVTQEREKTFELEYVYADEDDAEPVWMQLRATRFGRGEDLRAVVCIEDISRHKRIQLALDRSRRLFETLCMAAPVVIFQANGDGACRYISSHWDAMTGRSASEDLGFAWLHAIDPADYPGFRASWLGVRDSGNSFVAECRLHHADGHEVNVYIQAVRLRSVDGSEEPGWVGTITDLTQIEAATRELARAEQRQREVLQALPVFVYVLRPSACGLVEPVWLSSTADPFGHQFTDSLPDRDWWAEHLHPEDAPGVFAQFNAKMQTEDRWSYEYRLRRADGSYAWVADHLHAVRDEEGRLLELIGSLTDVSDRYAAEAAFRETAAGLRVAFEQAAVGMAHLEDGVVTRPNRRLLEMIGRTGSDHAAPDWSAWTHPEDRERDGAMLQSLLQGAATAGSLDKRLLRADGSDLWVHVTYSLIDAEGRPGTRIFTVVEDTSERRRIQGAANQALSTLDAIAEATFSFDPDRLQIFYVNEGALRQSAYSRTALLAMSLLDLQDPETRPRVLQLLTAAAAKPERGHRLETELVRRDGSRLPVEMAVQYIRSADQAPFYVAVTRDITERREARLRLEQLNAELEERVEQRTDALYATNLLLRNKEEQIRAIVENIPSCVITIDRDGIITSANAAVTPVFGIPVSAAIGRDLKELIPGLFEQIFRADLWKNSADHPTAESLLLKGSFEGLAANGEPRALEVSVGFYELHGEPQYAAIIRDVHEELAAKHELMRARTEAEQASRAKSAFLATMSHEIRTPMNGVLGMSELLLQSTLQRSDREMVETIQQSASTLLDLLDDILDFSKIEAGKLDLEIQPIELEQIVEAVCATHAAVADVKGVELRAYVSPSTPKSLDADPVRVRQILHNLVGNAVKFSAGREGVVGRVDLRVDARICQNGDLEVTLEIRDNGIGMTQEVLGRVFNPFTQGEGTTTRRFGGTGLGLSICKRLVELMEGEIVCHSLPGEGTIFTIAFRFDQGQWVPPAPLTGKVRSLHALVVSGDRTFLADAAVCLEALQVPYERFECGEEVAHWLSGGHDAEQETLAGGKPFVLAGPGADDWRQLQRMVAAACDHELPMVVWLPGQRQAAAAIDAGVITLGRTVLSPRGLGQAMAAVLGEGAADAPAPATMQACFLSEGVRLLIAEDHDINQRVIQRQLHRLGIRGDITGDGEQALGAWRRGGYDAILADLHMPRMDGYTLARAVRQEEARKGLPRIPIIAFTANAIIGDEVKCYEAGMDDVVTKPVELDRLREVLTRWLLSSPPTWTEEAPKAADTGTLPPSGHVDIRVLQGLVGDEPEVVADFLTEFRQGAMRLMLSLHATIATDAWRDALGIAHRLKSSARSVGAEQMGHLCERMERLCAEAEAGRDQATALLGELQQEWQLVAQEIIHCIGQTT